MNSARKFIKGMICGVRIEDVEDPLMPEILYLDKLIDELAKEKAMEKILRIEIGEKQKNSPANEQSAFKINHHQLTRG